MQAMALSLDDLVVNSVPGEPLKMTIPLKLLADEDLARIKVSLAAESEYTRQGLQQPPALHGLRVVLLANGKHAGRIKLYGEQPWQGNDMSLLLHVQWPGGEMIQRYSIVQADKKSSTPQYIEVAQDESLADIALRLSKHGSRSYLHMMVALFRANPEAFYRDNLNHLKVGARLRVPADEELYQLSDAEVNATLQEHEKRLKAERQQDVTEQRNRELVQELEQVTRNSAELEQRNRQLKERLAKLEQQVSEMSRQVLEYAARPESKPTAIKPPESAPPEAVEVEGVPDSVPGKRDDEGLSAWHMLLLLLLALLSVMWLRHYALRRRGEEQ